MHVTMVKKQLANGNACDKCVQAEALLRNRGLWDRIDRVAWAVEGDPNSEGMQLGARFDVDVAPFFIVRQASGEEAVYTSVLRFIKERLTSDGAPVGQPARSAAPANELTVSAVPPQSNKAPVGDDEIARAARDLADAPPEEILRWGFEHFGDACGIAFSGAEDVVLIHFAVNLGLPVSVFTLDTGRLHPETYQFIDQVRRHYGISIDVLSPDAPGLEAFVRQKGLFSFYQDGHEECCAIRKVEPLRRFLARLGGWATGQRRDQSPATRADIPVIQVDPTFTGRDGRLVKLNPLSRWSSAQVWQLIREASIPHNPLHERGFVSIGCAPCTRAILPGEHERAGRWWWEDSTRRECGLHIGNVVVPPGR